VDLRLMLCGNSRFGVPTPMTTLRDQEPKPVRFGDTGHQALA
jgi:hypothetical protein